MGGWTELFTKRLEDWIFISLNQNQVPDEPKINSDISADEAYITINLRSLRILNVRKLTTKFYGVVHSSISLNHLSGDEAAFQTVTVPNALRRIDPENLDRIIQINNSLLGPIPYRGGTVKMELGLFSVKESDLAAPFIDILETMASQAGVSIVSTALPFLGPLKKGIDAIIGTANDSILEIGLSTNFDPPKNGWYLVMRARKQDIDISKLRVTTPDFRLVNVDTNHLVQDFPYMIFTINQSKQRPDWFKLPDLVKPYQELQASVRKGDYNAANELLITFKRIVLTCNDLIEKDAIDIARLVKERTESIMIKTQTSSAGKRELPPLESYRLYI